TGEQGIGIVWIEKERGDEVSGVRCVGIIVVVTVRDAGVAKASINVVHSQGGIGGAIDLQVNVLAIEIVWIGRVGGAEAAITSKPHCPARAAAGRPHRAAVVLGSNNRGEGGRVGGDAVRLRDAEVVIEIEPTDGGRGGVNVACAIEAAVVAKI